MALYKDKYQTESNRLKNWDYSSEAICFITLVTDDRACVFGTIENDCMILNENGKIIEIEVLKSITSREKWFFHGWVIMPNHIHLLIEIAETHCVETHCSASLQSESELKPQNLLRKPNSIWSFVAIFKSVTTKQINLIDGSKQNKIWQSNYHDHIVRNYNSFDKIYYYIKNNPKNWNQDSINPY